MNETTEETLSDKLNKSKQKRLEKETKRLITSPQPKKEGELAGQVKDMGSLAQSMFGQFGQTNV